MLQSDLSHWDFVVTSYPPCHQHWLNPIYNTLNQSHGFSKDAVVANYDFEIGDLNHPQTIHVPHEHDPDHP